MRQSDRNKTKRTEHQKQTKITNVIQPIPKDSFTEGNNINIIKSKRKNPNPKMKQEAQM